MPLRFPANDPSSGFGLGNCPRRRGRLPQARANQPPSGRSFRRPGGPGRVRSLPLHGPPSVKDTPGTDNTRACTSFLSFMCVAVHPSPQRGHLGHKFFLLLRPGPGAPHFCSSPSRAPAVWDPSFSPPTYAPKLTIEHRCEPVTLLVCLPPRAPSTP